LFICVFDNYFCDWYLDVKVVLLIMRIVVSIDDPAFAWFFKLIGSFMIEVEVRA